MPFTEQQYDKAVEALTLGRTQLAPDGLCCAICGDGGHQAWECGHNPLYAMACCEGVAKSSGDLHENLHLMMGVRTYMGETVGPANVVLPDEA
jgi:hypothetical protein